MRITEYDTILNQEKQVFLVKGKAINYTAAKKLTTPESIYNMLCEVFGHNRRSEEYLYLICLNTNGKLQGVFEVSHGTNDASVCEPREIFQKALLCNAHHIVLAHNHPSGDVEPSKTDMATYRMVKDAGEMIGVKLVDNLIVGDTYYSFSEKGIE